MALTENLGALVGITDLSLLLEVKIKRKSNSWDIRTLLSIVWNAIKCDYLKTNNKEYYCNGSFEKTQFHIQMPVIAKP